MESHRRVIGLGVISLIISALLVFSFASEASDGPVEVLKNEFPTAGGTGFTLALVAREDIEHLQLRFSVLSPEDLSDEEVADPDSLERFAGDIGGYQIEPGSGPADFLGDILRLNWFSERMDGQGIVPENHTATIRIEESEYELLLHDYTRMMDHILGKNQTSTLELVFGAAVNATGHSFFFEGGSAFVPYDDMDILSVSHNDQKVTYVPDHQVSEGTLPLSAAPRGVLDFEDMERDDTVGIVIRIQPFADFALQVVKIYADGELFDEPIVNVMR